VPGQAALRNSPSSRTQESRQALLVRCLEAVLASQRGALEALAAGDEEALGATVSRAVQGVARLRECLDYVSSPVSAAYLNSIFDYVVAQMIASRGTRDTQCLHNAVHVISELRSTFLAVHRRASP
jgi:flagellin-specific chaperone FliS